MSGNIQLSFGPTCPSGGSWYACGDIFLGCCASYACTTSGCSQGNLRPVAFDASQYGKFPDASCGDGSNFYTCTADPTFWGCCKSNPCATGTCPDNDLTGAFVGEPKQSAYYLADEATSTTIAATGTWTTSVSSATTVVAPTSTSSTTTTASSSQSNSNTAAIASGSAGGGVVVALLICWLLYYICYVKRSRKKHQDELERLQSDYAIATMMETPKKSGGPYYPDGTPSGYSSPNPDLYGYGSYEPNAHAHQHDMANPTSVWKPQHRPRPSELSGETAWRGELESPMPSPHVKSVPEAPRINSDEEATWSDSHHYSGVGNVQPLGIHATSGDEVLQDACQSVARQ